MVGNVLGMDLADVARDGVTVGMVVTVGLAGVLVPLRSEDALAASRLESKARAANPGKKINEGELLQLCLLYGGGGAKQHLVERRDCHLGYWDLALFPTADRANVSS